MTKGSIHATVRLAPPRNLYPLSYTNGSLTILSPLILSADLLLLLGSEVVRNVESFADLFGRLALDHVGNSFTTDVKKRLDVEVVGCLSSNVSFQ